MDRRLIYNITAQDNDIRIEQFLRRKGYSRQNLVELKKMPSSILVNGIWLHLNEKLHTGDQLVIHIQENESSKLIPPVDMPIDIIYEDEDLIVINKSAGMPIHPSMDNYTNSLANALAYYYKKKELPFIFRCTNRLDRDTSGLTVIAKHMLSSNLLSTMTKNHEIKREYSAIVRGKLKPESGTICAPLSRKPGSIIERYVDFKNGQTAITHYYTELYANGHTLVRLQLETGRTHQIRIHLKYIGFPLIGDYLYNPDMEFINRQALHSCHLSFVHPITGKHMDFTAPLPDDMKRVLSL